jgi:hypothetical protein
MMDFSNNSDMNGTIGDDLIQHNTALVYLSIKGAAEPFFACLALCLVGH